MDPRQTMNINQRDFSRSLLSDFNHNVPLLEAENGSGEINPGNNEIFSGSQETIRKNDQVDQGKIYEIDDLQLRKNTELKIRNRSFQSASNLFRLFVKNGEYVYAKSSDIIMMESCDHLVKVYVSLNDKIKKTVRHNTLKDFLLQLPPEQFMRIGRFCAINLARLSGGSFNEQSFEFDFKVSVKLKHPISSAVFNCIGK